MALKLYWPLREPAKPELRKKAPAYVYDLPCMPFKYKCLEFEPDFPRELGEGKKATLKYEDIRPGWEKDYASKVIELCQSGKYLYVLCPTDYGVACELERRNVKFSVAYPDPSLKDEYEKRFIERGNGEEFLDVFIGGWDAFMQTCAEIAEGRRTYLLRSEEYLGSALNFPIAVMKISICPVMVDDEGNPPAMDEVREMLDLNADDVLVFDWAFGCKDVVENARVLRRAKFDDVEKLISEGAGEDLEGKLDLLGDEARRKFEQAALEVCDGFREEIESASESEGDLHLEEIRDLKSPVGEFYERDIEFYCEPGKHPLADAIAEFFESENGCTIIARVRPSEEYLEVVDIYTSNGRHDWNNLPDEIQTPAMSFIREKIFDVIPRLERMRVNDTFENCRLD